jgi:hypothetical protein|tara:strand:+ start:2857 stop:3078 length:222 start_codon:yes stop_codon:yes gene_type:complete
MTYDNTNKGALFQAKERKTEKHPNMTGKVNIDGKDFSLSAWSNTSKKGEKYLALKVSEFKPNGQQKQEDDLPF